MGNAKYVNAPLKNPENDARDMAEALKGLGFEVVKGFNLTFEQMRQLLLTFYRTAKMADVAVVYYSGHGIEFAGENYFVPIDAQLQDPRAIRDEAHSMTRVLDRLEDTSTARIIFLDACRNSPFVNELTRSTGKYRGLVGRGLGSIKSNAGAYIAFATAPGEVAYDGLPGARNSPFTAALTSHLKRPRNDLNGMMDSVRRSVVRATDGRQVPWASTSLLDSFYFGKRKQHSPTTVTDKAVQLPKEKHVEHGRLWKVVKRLNSVDYLKAFLDEFPNSPFANKARVLILRIHADATDGTKPNARVSAIGPTRQIGPANQNDFKPTSNSSLAHIITELNTASELKNGPSYFRDCETCPEMIELPTGSFLMGATERELGREPGEPPQRKVHILSPFSIGRFEVTTAEYRKCVEESACENVGLPSRKELSRMSQILEKRQPISGVSWNNARQFVVWLSRKTNKNYRLLSEAEWEYAARAQSQTRFSWGDEPDGKKAHCSDCLPKLTGDYIPLTGLFPPNFFGLSDMHGNLWEWTQDCLNRRTVDLRRDQWPQASDANSGVCTHRIVRGGSWANSSAKIRSAYRLASKPKLSGDLIGFRVARSNRKIDRLYQFIAEDYLSGGEINQRTVDQRYCSTVQYWGSRLNRSAVLRKMKRYNSRWPNREYRLRPQTVKFDLKQDGLISASFEYDFQVSSKNRRTKNRDRGVGLAHLDLKLNDGLWQICRENGRVVRRP